MTSATRDIAFMRRALRLAVRGRGWTSPNPLVGAVVVQDEQVVGQGYHKKVGGPHAEVNALRNAGERARGATLYVTLEPCNHQGRTPPCTHAVLQAEICRVVVGMADPNPNVDGSGAEFLRSRGVQVETGILESDCRRINQAFIKHVTSGLPYVVMKVAATLDGRIASRTGDARWISNERSRRFAHQLRHELDSILIGIGTALTDDPTLTVRLERRQCRQPTRIVLDTNLRLPLQSRLVKTAEEAPVWAVCSERASADKEKQLADRGARVVRLPGSEETVDLELLLKRMGEEQLASVLVEGGARIHGSFLDQGQVDSGCFFIAPKLLGDPQAVPMVSGQPRELMADAQMLHDLRVRRFGQDVMLTGRFRKDLY